MNKNNLFLIWFILVIISKNLLFATDSSINLLLSEKLPVEISRDVEIFGQGIFKQETPLISEETLTITEDYIIGRGDAFVLYIWGKVENVYEVEVNNNGEIYIPKVGVIPVEGLRFFELKKVLYKELSKFYTGFNLSVVMTKLKSIRVHVLGEVNKPGTYRLPGMAFVLDALYSAEGISKIGSIRNIKLIRNNETIKEIDLYKFLLQGDKSFNISLEPADVVYVPLAGPLVAILGHVKRPAVYELKEEKTLQELITLAGGFSVTAYKKRIQIERVENNRRVLIELDGENYSDFLLKDGDIVLILPIIKKFKDYVVVEGEVFYPGKYSIKENADLKYILQQAKLKKGAYLEEAKIIRKKKIPEIIRFNVEDVLKDKLKIKLIDEDIINIYRQEPEVSPKSPLIRVKITGEVNKPGEYYLKPQQRLKDLLIKADGFTEYAYPQATVLSNPLLKKPEEYIKRFSTLQKLELISYSERISLNKVEDLIEEQKSRLVLGEIVITLPDDINKITDKMNIQLMDGDCIYIPKRLDYVTVVGEVYNPGQVRWQEGKKIDFYLKQRGYFTKYADKRNIYIIKTNGSIVKEGLSRYFISPGDTIVVPYKLRLKPQLLPFLKDIISILWHLSTIVIMLSK
jgi:protein involved in polysaccharide export with SLBB domain